MRSYLVGAAVVGLTFYTALIYGSTALGLLGFAEATLVVLSFFYLLLYRRQVTASIHIPIATADLGKQVRVQITLQNKNPLPCAKLRYRIRMDNVFTGQTSRTWTMGEAAVHGENLFEQRMALPAVGSYTIELERLRIYDLCGLFFLTKRVKKSAKIQVLPEFLPIAVRVSERVRHFYGEAEQYDELQAGMDSSQIFDVREFRAGDKLQRIHWKLSAKSDELLVREDSQPLACAVVLLLDYHRPRGRKTDSASIYLTAAASLSFSMMDSACPHYAVYYSGSRQDTVRLRVDDEESLYLFLAYFMEDAAAVPAPLAQLYKEKYRYERPVHWMTLTNTALVLDERTIAQLDGKTWRRTLEQLEILL